MDKLREIAEAATPGPWEWGGNLPHDFRLQTTHSGRIFVMLFKRMGPQSAQPVFQINKRMTPAIDLATFEVGDAGVVGYEKAKDDGSVYRYDVNGIEAPDAKFIATFNPATVLSLLSTIKELVEAAKVSSEYMNFGSTPRLGAQNLRDEAIALTDAALTRAKSLMEQNNG